MAWTSLCELADLVEGQGKFVEIDGFRLAVFLNGGKPYVIDDRCPHAGASLSSGVVQDGCAVCPWHAWAFRLDNGELRNAPVVKIDTYACRIYEREGKPSLVQADLPIF